MFLFILKGESKLDPLLYRLPARYPLLSVEWTIPNGFRDDSSSVGLDFGVRKQRLDLTKKFEEIRPRVLVFLLRFVELLRDVKHGVFVSELNLKFVSRGVKEFVLLRVLLEMLRHICIDNYLDTPSKDWNDDVFALLAK